MNIQKNEKVLQSQISQINPRLLKNKYKVILEIPKTPFFVGSYVKVPIVIPKNSGMFFNDLEFKIANKSDGNIVSISHDNEFNPSKPDIMLCIGYKPGIYRLEAIRKKPVPLWVSQNLRLPLCGKMI